MWPLQLLPRTAAGALRLLRLLALALGPHGGRAALTLTLAPAPALALALALAMVDELPAL